VHVKLNARLKMPCLLLYLMIDRLITHRFDIPDGLVRYVMRLNVPSTNITLIYIRWGCYNETGTIRALDQDHSESPHNPIAAIPLLLRVTAMGNEGDYHDDDTV